MAPLEYPSLSVCLSVCLIDPATVNPNVLPAVFSIVQVSVISSCQSVKRTVRASAGQSGSRRLTSQSVKRSGGVTVRKSLPLARRVFNIKTAGAPRWAPTASSPRAE